MPAFALAIAAISIAGTAAIAQPRVDVSKYYKETLVPWSTAKSFLIYHVDTGKEVASLNPEYSAPVASLTKMMTVLIADEELSYGVGYELAEDEAKIFKVEQLTLDQMVEMALVPSNNLVCKVLARLIDGSEPAFVSRMNKRAAELGMTGTRYANASGLPSKSAQYSNVRDQLILTLELLKRPVPAEKCRKHWIFFDERYDSTIFYLKEKYPIAGVKSGWTNAAGRCLSLLVETEQFGSFIVITMGSSSIAQGFVDAEIILSRFGLVELAPGSLLAAARLQEAEREKAHKEAEAAKISGTSGIAQVKS
ncbi:MAG: D-alanyl-D-alanine carboxypeptidase [bacterium]